MRKYKTPKVILQHARDWLADPSNWAQGALEVCFSYHALQELAEGERDEAVPLFDPKLAAKENEHCAGCILGAVRRFSNELSNFNYEQSVMATPAGQLVEEAARDLYRDQLVEQLAHQRYLVRQRTRRIRKKNGEPPNPAGAPTGKVGVRKEVEALVDGEDNDFGVAVAVNDGDAHSDPRDAHKAILRILDRAIELAS